MARSVTISTPIPSLEEVGKSLGLSKRRQDSLLRLVRRNSVTGQFVTRRSDNAVTERERVSVSRTKK